jgi:hypothetical protein
MARRLVALLGCLGMLVACGGGSGSRPSCATAADCADGMCRGVPEGGASYCVARAPDCPGMAWRWDDAAGRGLAGTCVALAARTPAYGAATGGELDPVFTWEDAGAPRYELQLDSTCDPKAFLACGFDAPTLSVSVPEPRFQPTQPLPISFATPQGRRYYWRVRACADAGCSPWSRVRYLDVARSPIDFNGDGFPDLLVGATGNDTDGLAYVFAGSSTGLGSEPTVELFAPLDVAGARFGWRVAAVGDVNADGFADAVITADLAYPTGVLAGRGAAFLYLGSAAGLSATPQERHELAPNETVAGFGSSLAAAGDVDGDGFVDVVIGAPYAESRRGCGAAYVLHGSSTGLVGGDDATVLECLGDDWAGHGLEVAGGGDLDGDGFADVAVTAGARQPGHAGAVMLYRGSAAGPGAGPDAILRSTDHGDLGRALVFADLDADGLADVVASAPEADGDAGAVLLYPHPLAAATVSKVLRAPTPQAGAAFGWSVAAGDVSGDGLDDLVVGSRFLDGSAPHSGGAVVLLAGARGLAGGGTRARQLVRAAAQEGAEAGTAVTARDVDGDGAAEIFVGAPEQDGSAPDEGVVFVYPSGNGDAATEPAAILSNPRAASTGWFGASLD